MKQHEKKHEEKFVKQEEYDALKELAQQFENLYKRSVADYQNLEKRITAEKQEWIKLANKDLLLRLLPGLDNLILAEKHTEDEGVKISIKHFLDIFTEIGVKKIETIGQDFRPEQMEAVGVIEGEENKVIEEARAGYTLFDFVLRPAQVVVGTTVGKNS
jgi:molecular chaperone GrpE